MLIPLNSTSLVSPIYSYIYGRYCVKYILPKRLETPATETKQTTEDASNRYKNDTPEKPDKPASESPATPEYRPIRFADTPRTRRIGRFVVHKPNQSESAATETKQTTDLVSDRNNNPAP